MQNAQFQKEFEKIQSYNHKYPMQNITASSGLHHINHSTPTANHKRSSLVNSAKKNSSSSPSTSKPASSTASTSATALASSSGLAATSASFSRSPSASSSSSSIESDSASSSRSSSASSSTSHLGGAYPNAKLNRLAPTTPTYNRSDDDQYRYDRSIPTRQSKRPAPSNDCTQESTLVGDSFMENMSDSQLKTLIINQTKVRICFSLPYLIFNN